MKIGKDRTNSFTHIQVIIEPETLIIKDRFCETVMKSLFFEKGQVYFND